MKKGAADDGIFKLSDLFWGFRLVMIDDGSILT